MGFCKKKRIKYLIMILVGYEQEEQRQDETVSP